MSTETIIALVASCTSLLVAGISIFAAFVSSLQARRTAESAEKLKFHYSLDGTTQSLRDEQFSHSLTALQRIIQSIQKLKDNLQIILYDPALPTARIQEIIEECRSNILETYEEHLIYYSPEDAKLGHSAKNLALTIERIVKAEQNLGRTNGINEDAIEKIVELRSQLTDIQNLLRDSTLRKMSDRLGWGAVQHGKQ